LEERTKFRKLLVENMVKAAKGKEPAASMDMNPGQTEAKGKDAKPR
jgi:hypothetical protein